MNDPCAGDDGFMFVCIEGALGISLPEFGGALHFCNSVDGKKRFFYNNDCREVGICLFVGDIFFFFCIL